MQRVDMNPTIGFTENASYLKTLAQVSSNLGAG